jgi:hypothetical protein
LGSVDSRDFNVMVYRVPRIIKVSEASQLIVFEWRSRAAVAAPSHRGSVLELELGPCGLNTSLLAEVLGDAFPMHATLSVPESPI